MNEQPADVADIDGLLEEERRQSGTRLDVAILHVSDVEVHATGVAVGLLFQRTRAGLHPLELGRNGDAVLGEHRHGVPDRLL